jgi:hypothetical protein
VGNEEGTGLQQASAPMGEEIMTGTGMVAAQAQKAAADAVKASWVAKQRVLSEAEIDQMMLEVRVAELNALFAHIAATAVVTGVATVSTAPGAAPVVGTVA